MVPHKSTRASPSQLACSFISPSSPPTMDPANYRARLLRDVFQDYLLPIFCWRCILSYLPYRWGVFSVPTYPVFVILWITTRSKIIEAQRERRARALNAKTIPCVRGRWPGNVDVLLKMMRAFKTSYVLDVYLQLFEEYQCTTLNLRLLWRDNVCFLWLLWRLLGVQDMN